MHPFSPKMKKKKKGEWYKLLSIKKEKKEKEKGYTHYKKEKIPESKEVKAIFHHWRTTDPYKDW